MSFLSRLFGQNDITDAQLAMIDGLCLSLCADGSTVEAEVNEAVGFVVGLTRVSEGEAKALLQKSLQRIAKDSEAVLKSLPRRATTQEQREGVMFAALFIQYMDGQITHGEDEIINVLSATLELSDACVQDLIVEVESQLEAYSEIK